MSNTLQDFGASEAKKSLYSLSSLILFRNIKEDKLIKNLQVFLSLYIRMAENDNLSVSEKCTIIDAYAKLYGEIEERDSLVSLFSCLVSLLKADDNAFSRYAASRGSTWERVPENILRQADRELASLEILFRLSGELFTAKISRETGLSLPCWKASANSHGLKKELFSHWQKDGFGLFSLNRAFIWKDRTLHPVPHPDPILRTDLFSYEYEIEKVEDNTKCLISGKPAENLLLFGARGAGKSSVVKAMVNTWYSDGLRLIEINKDDLLSIPDLLEYIRVFLTTRYTFILFLDDLSFTENDTRYTALKTLLEGGIKTRPQNTAIYATTNRRHILAEKKEIALYENDSRNERLSLSDRFGMKIRFAMPTQEEYFFIVRGILRNRNLAFDDREIEEKSQKWAMQENGFSPRTARQFCDYYENSL